ncbi:MAG: hypothetical protein WCY89_12310 [Flavobacteriaceae bacterium]
MTKFFQTTFFFISVLFLASCSSDDSEGGSSSKNFTLNGETYRVEQAVIQVFNDSESNTSDASISLTGSKGGKVASISFSVFYNTSNGIEGVYTSDEDSWDQIEDTYSSWLSMYSITQNMDMTTSNQPVGPVTIISHGNNQYTLEFDVTYADNVTASASVKTTFAIQSMGF